VLVVARGRGHWLRLGLILGLRIEIVKALVPGVVAVEQREEVYAGLDCRHDSRCDAIAWIVSLILLSSLT
jgi:hypothetical protein